MEHLLAPLHERAQLLALGLRGLHAAAAAGDPLDAGDLVPLVNLGANVANALAEAAAPAPGGPMRAVSGE